MVENMKENIKMIKKMDMVYIIGQMEKNMMVCGVKVNKMDKDYLYLQMDHKNMVFGKMVKELDG